MKKVYLLSISLISLFGLQAQDCSNIFISEYVEGWNNNKAIELYNPTENNIDLSNYSLSRWGNGSTTPQPTVLEGIIEPYSTFVIGLDKRDPNGEGYEAPLWNGWYVFTDSITGMLDSIYTDEDNLMDRVDLFICPNYEDGTMYFNGNDAISLETLAGDIIDVFGKIGEDPGQAWSDADGAFWTKDQTLMRKESVVSGFVYDTSVEYVFDPTLEWDSLPANTFTGLGVHVCECEPFNLYEAQTNFDLYPNPNTSGELFINTLKPLKQIQLFNILGQLVDAKYTNAHEIHTMQLNPKMKGMYLVKVIFEDNQSSIKKLLVK